MEPYVNWVNAHAGFLTIVQVPTAEWKVVLFIAGGVEMLRYAPIFYAFIFFAFFRFAEKARRLGLVYVSVAKRVGLSTSTMSTTDCQ